MTLRCVPYPLVYDDGWQVDLDALAASWDSRTRAVLVVHPNNPTGSYVQRRELERMIEICHQNGAAIIADEVFADYGFRRGRGTSGDPRGKLGGPHLHAQRAIQNLRFAADEAGVDCCERPAGIACRSSGAPRGDRRHLPFRERARGSGHAHVACASADHSIANIGARANQSAQAR